MKTKKIGKKGGKNYLLSSHYFMGLKLRTEFARVSASKWQNPEQSSLPQSVLPTVPLPALSVGNNETMINLTIH